MTDIVSSPNFISVFVRIYLLFVPCSSPFIFLRLFCFYVCPWVPDFCLFFLDFPIGCLFSAISVRFLNLIACLPFFVLQISLPFLRLPSKFDQFSSYFPLA